MTARCEREEHRKEEIPRGGNNIIGSLRERKRPNSLDYLPLQPRTGVTKELDATWEIRARDRAGLLASQKNQTF